MALLENKMQQASATLLDGKTQDEDFDTEPPTFRRIANLIPNPGNKKKSNLGFGNAEHTYIGDAITLILEDNSKVIAKDHTFKLENGLSVTYGQINGLGGDFYGTSRPICDGYTKEDQIDRFTAAYSSLAKGRRAETEDILKVLKEEADTINAAVAANEDPSEAYSRLPKHDARLQVITAFRPIPSYLDLALINYDHFGIDARAAYNAGHTAALQVAMNDDLEKAYTMNAFADHYLEDSFSAGHLRTPRRYLSGSLQSNYCAMLMHDEDCAIGLTVQNPAGETWKCFGDKRALDRADSENKKRCLEAIQTSADEIYDVWKNKTVLTKYGAWDHAPTLESASADQNLAALFKGSKMRREDLFDRRKDKYTESWGPTATALRCKKSDWWNYPITIDGPTGVLNKTAIATTAAENLASSIYYQNADRTIAEKILSANDVGWNTRSGLVCKPKLFSPLAAISRGIWFDKAPEVHVYCISNEGELEEWWRSSPSTAWSRTDLTKLKVCPAKNTKIAAVWLDSGNIRVYVQDRENRIQEYIGPNWAKGATFPVALSGTSLSVAHWNGPGNTVYVRLYYQDTDMTLKEHCMDGYWGTWVDGAFKTNPTLPLTSIASLPKRVYCQDQVGDIQGFKIDTDWVDDIKVVTSLPLGGFSSALEVGGGGDRRFYYQADDNRIYEKIQSNGGGWVQRSIIT